MTNSRKNLRDISTIVLFFAVINCVREVLNIFLVDFKMATLPEGATEGLVLVTQIVMAAFALIFLIPDLYVGVKGLKVAKKPDSSKAHIVWATILAVLSVFALLSHISGLAQSGIVNGLINIIGTAADVAIYVCYIVCAKQVRKTA